MNEGILEDFCELIVDCPHSTAPDEGSGYPLIRTPNVGRGRLILEGVHRVSQKTYNERNFRAIPQDDDLIFAREAPAGNVAVIKNGEKVCLGQRTVLIRPDKNKVDADYLAYYLLSPEQQYGLLGTANGATVAHVNIPVIRNLKICLPDLATQRRISSILSQYDSLIENCRCQIKLLEEAAQRTYREWFVEMRFPGHENVRMEDGLPEGWKRDIIMNVCLRINAGGTPSRQKKSYWENANVKWFKTQELQDCWLLDSDEKISEEGLCNSSAKIMPKNTVVMAIYASPTLGRLGILSEEACTNQAALGLLADETKISWQYLYEKLYELRDEFNAVAKGAGQQNISAETVKKKEIVIPSYDICKQYKDLVSTLYDKRNILQKQIRFLQQSRDLMLPRLMRGEEKI